MCLLYCCVILLALFFFLCHEQLAEIKKMSWSLKVYPFKMYSISELQGPNGGGLCIELSHVVIVPYKPSSTQIQCTMAGSTFGSLAEVEKSNVTLRFFRMVIFKVPEPS